MNRKLIEAVAEIKDYMDSLSQAVAQESEDDPKVMQEIMDLFDDVGHIAITAAVEASLTVMDDF